MAKRLNGKTALVTGATSNIGRAIAEAFAAEEAYVVVAGRNVERGTLVVNGIRARGGRAEFVRADLDGSAAASQALAEQATRVLGGRIDVLVNNAGIYPGGTTAATDDKTFDEVYAVNVKARSSSPPPSRPRWSRRAAARSSTWAPGSPAWAFPSAPSTAPPRERWRP